MENGINTKYNTNKGAVIGKEEHKKKKDTKNFINNINLASLRLCEII